MIEYLNKLKIKTSLGDFDEPIELFLTDLKYHRWSYKIINEDPE